MVHYLRRGALAVGGPGHSATPAKPRRHWLLALFGLPFALGGIAVLAFLVLPTVVDAWRARSWEQGEARLTGARLETEVDEDSTTYRARATYTYEYRGREYGSERVAIGDDRDNIGSFQQDLARRLIRALEAGEPVPVWINPEEPQEAVLNRNLRWKVVALWLAVGVLFTGVGGSLVWLALRQRRTTAAAGAADKPWLLRPEWASPEIQSGGGSTVAWAAAVVWNVIAVPLGIVCASEFFDGNKPAALGLLFPLAGAYLFVYAIGRTLAWRRFGRAPLVMDPYPGAIGGQVGGTMDVRLAHAQEVEFRTSLTCIYSSMSGRGKNRRRKERVIWETEGVAHTVPRLEYTQLEILFDVDSGLPSSEPKDERAYHLWRLRVEGDVPGVDFERVFEIPVFPTGASAHALRRLSTEHRAAAENRARSIDQVLDIQHVPGGIELYYPPFRHPLAKLLGLFLGSVFVGFTVLAAGAPAPIRVIFGLAGAAIVAASLYNLLLSLRVRIDHQRLEVTRRLLGLPSGETTVARDEIECLTLKQSYSMSSGGKHSVYFKLQALASGGRAVKIGHNLPGREAAKQALQQLARSTGIPIDPEIEGNVLA